MLKEATRNLEFIDRVENDIDFGKNFVKRIVTKDKLFIDFVKSKFYVECLE